MHNACSEAWAGTKWLGQESLSVTRSILWTNTTQPASPCLQHGAAGHTEMLVCHVLPIWGSPVNSLGSWTRWAPEMISSPRMKMSKELLYSGSSGSGIV